MGEFIKGEKNPKVIGVGEYPTLGIRHGYVVSVDEAVESVKQAVNMAEKNAGIKIKRAFIALNGVTLRGDASIGGAIISKADGEVTNLDTNKALEECENNLNLGNRKVIQVSPIAFKLDGKEVLGRPEGMHGNKLEVRALITTCSNQHVEDLIAVITEAGITPADIVIGPISASNLVLNKKQKIVGCALVNIGSETTSIATFENENIIGLHTFSIGSSDITNDIALGMKITLEEAENMKLGNTNLEYSKKKLDEIIEARLGDMFELIENHLKKIKRSELLPAGIVFIGGGANTIKIEEYSKASLKLPSRVGSSEIFGNTKTKLRDPAWSTVLSLLFINKQNENYSDSTFAQTFKDFKKTIRGGLRQLLP